MSKCPTCNNIIPDKGIYCSQDCYYNRNADNTGICIWCENEFRPIKNQTRFYSRNCYYDWKHHNKLPEEYHKEWHKRYKREYRNELSKLSRQWRQNRRDIISQLKSDRGCDICKEDHPACLEFHHPNEDRKGGLTIAALVSGGYSWDRIISEIEDLKLLCANCHRKQHHPWFRSE